MKEESKKPVSIKLKPAKPSFKFDIVEMDMKDLCDEWRKMRNRREATK